MNCNLPRYLNKTQAMPRRAISSAVRTPVLIVGGGPVGLYASALLSHFGVPSLLIERFSRGLRHPRSHLINTRTMELLRELRVERRVRALAPPQAEWRSFRYCTTLLGEEIALYDHLAARGWTALHAASPTEIIHVSQPGLERVLREEALLLAPQVGAALHFGYECGDIEQHAAGVRVQLHRMAATGALGGRGGRKGEGVGKDDGDVGSATYVEAAHLLACDGASSPIRRALRVELRGPPTLQHFRSVHFRDRSGHLSARLEGRGSMLYFVFNPAVNITPPQHPSVPTLNRQCSSFDFSVR